MAEPPTYEESISGTRTIQEKSDRKTPVPWSIREQIGLSRTQHVALIVSQVVDHIRERAQRGLSKTTLVLIPSDQDGSSKGKLVGFPDDDVPAMIQFEGLQNSMQFWSQDSVLSELKEQLQDAVSEGMPSTSCQERPEESAMPPPKKASWLSRKPSKTAEPVREPQPPPLCSVKVDVQLDEIYFRGETEYGLYQTLRVRAVIASVDVR